MPPTYMDRYRFAFSDLPAPIFCAWLLIQGLTGGGPLSILFGLIGGVFILFKRMQGELITAARRIFDCRKLWNGYTENRSVPADFREIAQLGD